MDISFLNEYVNLVIVGICLCVGYVIKRWVKDVDNKYIPTIVFALGTLLAVWMNWGSLSAQVVLGGMISGLASTGLHQAFTQLPGSKEA